MRIEAGHVVVITGGASGIGLAVARRVASGGAHVVLGDVEAGALEAAAAELRAVRGAGEVAGVLTDVTDPEAVEALAVSAYDTFGHVDLVALNAGVTASGAAWESTLDDWRWLLEVNLLGVVHGVRSFVPRMIAGGRPGHVLVTSSLAGYLNQPGFAAYNASKHAVAALAETLAADLARAGHPIGVTVLAPWFVATRLGEAARNRPAELADAAGRSAFLDDLWRELAPMREHTQSADDVAAMTLDAVAAGRFAVFPFEPSLDAVRASTDALLAGRVLGLYLPPGAAES